jgi:HK97 family phage major capsid protein
MNMITKNITLKAVESEDLPDRVKVAGYLTTFDNKDYYNDIITEGAVKDSIGDINLKMLVDHEHYRITGIVGKIEKTIKDDKGLFGEGYVLKTEETQKHLIPLLKAGLVDSFSIGFIGKEYTNNEFKGRTFTNIELKEVSIVNFPANESAKILEVKQKEELPTVDKNVQDPRVEDILKRQDELETELKTLKYEKKEMKNAEEKSPENEFLKFITTPKDIRTKAVGQYNTLVNADGGFLVPTLFVNELFKGIFNETGSIRSLVDVAQKKGKEFSFFTQTKVPYAYFEAEGNPTVKSKSQFGKIQATSKRLTAGTDATWEFLNYQDVYSKSRIVEDLRDAISSTIDYQILNGNHATGLEGIFTNTAIEKVDTAVAATLDWKDFMKAFSKIKTGYAQDIIMHRETFYKLQTMVDSQQRPIFEYVELREAENKGRFMGKKLTLVGSANIAGVDTLMMPTVSIAGAFVTGTKPIIVGDLKRAYKLIVAQDMIFSEDPYTGMDSMKMNWYLNMWLDGIVVQPEALKIINIK